MAYPQIGDTVKIKENYPIDGEVNTEPEVYPGMIGIIIEMDMSDEYPLHVSFAEDEEELETVYDYPRFKLCELQVRKE